MKIKLPFLKKNLYIENRYSYPTSIVSIGCDCQPAYLLDTLHLRDKSLPFDWLKTEPLKGLKFVTENLKDEFKNLMTNLTINQNGNTVSRNFPYAEFYHDRDLQTNSNSKEKYERKIGRLLKIFHSESIAFLYTFPASALTTEDKINYFANTVREFLEIIKPSDTLHIYMTCELNNNEESTLFKRLKKIIGTYTNLVLCYHHKQSSIFGIWGDETSYVGLLEKMNLKVNKDKFPQIYLSAY